MSSTPSLATAADVDVVEVHGEGDIRPGWLIALQAALESAREAGWNPTEVIVMQGYPYIFEGEPRMSTWTLDDPADPVPW